MSFEIGQVVGDYEIIAPLGAGGMGSVYKVRNVVSDRVEAIKVLLPDLQASPDLAERFVNEIKVLGSFRHPNIATLHTAMRLNNQLVMSMELVDGINLEDRMRPGALPINEALNLISQVLEALAYAHARGIIHRDIKPANIAVNSEGVVKLLDFGIARAGSDRRLTRTGMVLGSLYYMSPEQVNGHSADARSDLYSVGITLYRAVTGRRPIDADSEFALMRAHVRQIPAPPCDIDAAIPRGLSDAIMRSLAKAPEDRFQTAEEFRSALVPYLQSLAARPSRDPITASRSDPSLFQPATLASLERHFAAYVGPIAGAIVRQQSRAATSLSELCHLLAGQIQSETDRRAFLRACARELGPTVSTSEFAATTASKIPEQSAEPVAWDPALLERSTKELAGYIGPVAKVMVDRAAKKAHSVEELFALLGAEISSAKDRERFLVAASRANRT